MAVGDRMTNSLGRPVGGILVYEFDGDNWTQIGSSITNDPTNFLWPGASVSLSATGDILAVAASGQRTNTSAGNPAMRMYRFVDNEWELMGSTIVGDGPRHPEVSQAHDIRLSNSGKRVVMSGLFSDRVGVFDYSEETSEWQEVLGDGEALMFGNAASISGDGKRVAVGSNNPQTGMVLTRIYEWTEDDDVNSAGHWAQLGDDIEALEFATRSGWSISLADNGARIAVGSRGNVVQVFELADGEWVELGDVIVGEAAGDTAGFHVSLSNDGDSLVIGAINNDGSGNSSGHARVYRFQNDGEWTQVGEDLDGYGPGDQFGWCVSIDADGNRIAVGSLSSGQAHGHVSVFDWPN